MTLDVTESPVFLSTLAAADSQRKLAAIVVLVSVLLFCALVPFAKLPLPKVWAFIPTYEAALVINDLITAVLLFGQFGILRSRALFVLACAYLFTAFTAIAHALTFPGLFAPTGLLGAGSQSTVWLYMFWHGAFPLLVIAYALLKDKEPKSKIYGSAPHIILAGVAISLTVVMGFVWLVTAGHDALPVLLLGGHYTVTMNVVVTVVWSLSLCALSILGRRGPHSVLDLWLMVVLCAWIFDIGLAAVFNAARFDLGFYAGRIYGLLAASFVLMVLLLENGMLYARLVAASAELRRLNAVDPLTGVANRRAFEEAMDREWRRAMRNQTPLSILMIDVDFFKRYNDTYGHVAGDECLRMLAEVLSMAVKRAGDMVTRYGGEEFVVLLPNTGASDARRVAQRLCQGVSDLGIPHAGSDVAEHVTISVGVASLRHTTAKEIDPLAVAAEWMKTVSQSPSMFVEAADQALYTAKHAGRCQVSDRLFDVVPVEH